MKNIPPLKNLFPCFSRVLVRLILHPLKNFHYRNDIALATPPPPFMVFQMHGHTRKWDPGNRSKRGEVSNGSGSIPRIGEGHGSVNNASENMSKKWCWGWVLTLSVNKPRLYRGGADCTFNQWRKTVDYCLKVVFFYNTLTNMEPQMSMLIAYSDVQCVSEYYTSIWNYKFFYF